MTVWEEIKEMHERIEELESEYCEKCQELNCDNCRADEERRTDEQT